MISTFISAANKKKELFYFWLQFQDDEKDN